MTYFSCRRLPAFYLHLLEVRFSAFYDSESTGMNAIPVVIFIWEAYSFQLHSSIVDLSTVQGPSACDPTCQVTAEQEKEEELCGRCISSHIMAESPCFRYVSVMALLIAGFTLLKSSPVQQFLSHSMISYGPDYSWLTDYRSGCLGLSGTKAHEAEQKLWGPKVKLQVHDLFSENTWDSVREVRQMSLSQCLRLGRSASCRAQQLI